MIERVVIMLKRTLIMILKNQNPLKKKAFLRRYSVYLEIKELKLVILLILISIIIIAIIQVKIKIIVKMKMK